MENRPAACGRGAEDAGLPLDGLRVDNSDDAPVLLTADGDPVDTWREGYPYAERMRRDICAGPADRGSAAEVYEHGEHTFRYFPRL